MTEGYELTGKYCHEEGFTDFTLTADGRKLVTYGSDGEIRIWESIGSEPIFLPMEDVPCAIDSFGDNFLVGTDNFTVDMYSLSTLTRENTVLKFTGKPTHIVSNADGLLIAAGCCDMNIKCVDSRKSDKRFLQFSGHSSAVLSLALDPQGQYLASSSADGTLKIWSLETEACLRTEYNLIVKSNDFETSTVLCRLAFSPGDGKFLAVPSTDGVRVFARDSWDFQFTLAESGVSSYSSVDFSSCGRYLACGCTDGHLLIWDWKIKRLMSKWQRLNNDPDDDVEKRDKRPLKLFAIRWFCEASGNEPVVVFTDEKGFMGKASNPVVRSSDSVPSENVPSVCSDPKVLSEADIDFLEEMDEDMLLEAVNNAEILLKPPASQELQNRRITPEQDAQKQTDDSSDDAPMDGYVDDEDDDDNNVISLAKIKAESGFLDDETRALQAQQKEDDEVSLLSTKSYVARDFTNFERQIEKLKPKLQAPFQPGSTPPRLEHRYMKWNSAGIVTCYKNKTEIMVDVEFHNIGIHPPFHRDFPTEYSMADLSVEALVLAGEGSVEENQRSKLFVEPLNGFGNKREWTLEMPPNEDICCVSLGSGWIVVATSSRLLKIFSLGGVAMMPAISISGDVVCVVGFGDLLAIIFHRGVGDGGDQNLGYSIMNVKKRSLIKENGNFPLSPKSFLFWMGFTDEGSLCSVDSMGVVRLCPQAGRGLWYPILNLNEGLACKSDQYFVIGISERKESVRCVLCKGSRFPVTVPRPMITSLPFKLPLDGFDAEHVIMQEAAWGKRLLASCLQNISEQGADVSNDISVANADVSANMMRLFALACKNGRDMFAFDLAQLMPTEHLGLVVKYAVTQNRLLAEKVNELLREREESTDDIDEDPEKCDLLDKRDLWSRAPEKDLGLDAGNSSVPVMPTAVTLKSRRSFGVQRGSEHDNESTLAANFSDSYANRSYSSNPLLAASELAKARSAVLQGKNAESRANPFKKDHVEESSNAHNRSIGDGNTVFDSLEVSAQKIEAKKVLGNRKNESISNDVSSKKSKQLKLFATSEGKKGMQQPPKIAGSSSKLPPFPEWFKTERENILKDLPDAEEKEVVKEAMDRFKKLKQSRQPSSLTKEVVPLKEDKHTKRKLENAKENSAAHSDSEKDGDPTAKKLKSSGKFRFAQFAQEDS